MNEEQFKKEIASLKQELAQIRRELKLHTHNGFDSGKEFEAPIITGGTIQTAREGFRLVMSGENNSYEFRSSGLLLAELVSTTVPFSGLSGAALKHGIGTIMIEVSGNGEGLGTRQVLLTNDDGSVAFGIVDNDDGNFYIEATGLPTSDPGGTGRIWSNAGVLNIT